VLIFLDVETTGLEIDDKICSVGIVALKDNELIEKYELVNELKKIPPKASSIHHITNEMIADKKRFKGGEIYHFLELHNNIDTTIVAHNVKFDLDKLLSGGLVWNGGVIDTLRVTKHLIPECEYFSLHFLRYELKLYKNEQRQLYAHHALDDAHVTKNLYEYLLDFVTEERMQALSFEPVLLQKMNFGKFSGRYIEDIALNERGYLEWVLANIVDLDEDLRYSITYFLQEVL